MGQNMVKTRFLATLQKHMNSYSLLCATSLKSYFQRSVLLQYSFAHYLLSYLNFSLNCLECHCCLNTIGVIR